MTTTTLLITFDLPLRLDEVPWFRGSVLKTVEAGDEQVMMHNHQGDNYRYSYPLVQYKSIDGRAAILCIGQGIELSGRILNVTNRHVVIGRRSATIVVRDVIPQFTDIAIGGIHNYRIQNWLPFNDRNYQEFQRAPDDSHRIELLENLLVGNILSMSKGLGIYFDQQVICQILTVDDCQYIKCKSVDMLSFDLHFSSNITLPDLIGLGKHTSFGYGQLFPE